MKIFKSFKKINKKSLSAFILSAVMLVSMSSFAIVAYAYEWQHPTNGSEFNVTLYADQSYTYSGAKVDPYIHYEGKNSGSERIKFMPQYSTDDQKNWATDSPQVVTVSAGGTLEKQTSNKFYNPKPWWRLRLANYGGKGGTGYGWCW